MGNVFGYALNPLTLIAEDHPVMDKIYPVSILAFIGLFGQWSPKDAESWESVGFKSFLIIVVIALACYQLYRDRLDRAKADERHVEVRQDLKDIFEKLHEAELTHTRLAESNERQLAESKVIRAENSEMFRRQWDMLARDKKT
jgi:hypothetical protein